MVTIQRSGNDPEKWSLAEKRYYRFVGMRDEQEMQPEVDAFRLKTGYATRRGRTHDVTTYVPDRHLLPPVEDDVPRESKRAKAEEDGDADEHFLELPALLDLISGAPPPLAPLLPPTVVTIGGAAPPALRVLNFRS